MTEPSPSDIQTLKETYVAFNGRDIDSALVNMTREVKWPRAFKGGFVTGPEAIRDYWTKQWSEIDPTVDPISIIRESETSVLVEVHQVVRDLEGTMAADDTVYHRFTFVDGLIDKMEVCELPTPDNTDSTT